MQRVDHRPAYLSTLHTHHFDPGIAYVEDLEFIVADDDVVFQAGDGLMLVDDVTR